MDDSTTVYAELVHIFRRPLDLVLIVISAET